MAEETQALAVLFADISRSTVLYETLGTLPLSRQWPTASNSLPIVPPPIGAL